MNLPHGRTSVKDVTVVAGWWYRCAPRADLSRRGRGAAAVATGDRARVQALAFHSIKRGRPWLTTRWPVWRKGRFDVRIDRHVVRAGYDRRTGWVHARGATLPGSSTAVITMQRLRLDRSDVFYEINDLWSNDAGATWSEPTPHPATLGRRPVGGGLDEGVSDFTPAWHSATGTLLGTGHTVRYLDDALAPAPWRRSTAYSAYHVEAQRWSRWRRLATPFGSEGAGCAQRVDLPDGSVLLPTCVNAAAGRMAATVMRCSYDGETLRYDQHGDVMTVAHGRGLDEPSLVFAAGRYFLTFRNGDAGYVAVGDDGLHYAEPRVWRFDDGTVLGNYNTQQHWAVHHDSLHLVYTRRGADNDHVFRHRAPLFAAQVDTERLCVIRDSERIVVPERGARLGNFGVVSVSDDEAWVIAAEWMQTNPPDPYDSRVCERYGSDNSVFLSKITFPRRQEGW